MTWHVQSIVACPASNNAPCNCSHGYGRAHPATFTANWRLDADGPKGPVYPKAVCLNRASAIADEFRLKPWPFGPGQHEARNV